jgi:hypothetical protein
VVLVHSLWVKQLHLFEKWVKEDDWLRFHVEECDE